MIQDNKIFTIDQIYDVFKKVKSGADFPQFVQNLKTIGVTHYDSYVTDGRTIYYGANDFRIEVEPKYSPLKISSDSSVEKLKHFIFIHQQGQTDYPTFCNQVAATGVEKWTTHIVDMTVTYFDKQGNKLIAERIPQP